jgi:hypothetical protein
LQSRIKIDFSYGWWAGLGIWLAESFEQTLAIASDHAPVGTIQQHAAAHLIARKVYGRPQGAAQHLELVRLILSQLEADGHRALLHGGSVCLKRQ